MCEWCEAVERGVGQEQQLCGSCVEGGRSEEVKRGVGQAPKLCESCVKGGVSE